jgi:hypothetical protein
MSHTSKLLRAACAAIGLVLLSGCVIAPAYPPGYYRPHYHYWGY